MTDRNVLYLKQTDIIVTIKRILRNLQTEKACNKTQNYFEKHGHDLETLWKDFCTNHEQLKNERNKKRDLYFKSGSFSVAEAVYKTTRDKLHKMHQYYKMTKFPKDGQGSGSSQTNDIQQTNDKHEIEETIADDHLDMDGEINPVKLLENSDVPTISESAVINMEESSNGVEFMSVELLLNELSAQTQAQEQAHEQTQAQEESQGTTKTQDTYEQKNKRPRIRDEVPATPRTPRQLAIRKFKQKKTTKTNEKIDSILQIFDEHPGLKVRCPIKGCTTHLAKKDRMIRHIRVHNGEMPYQCNSCDYATYNSTRFQEHINAHSGLKPYKCIFCNYSSVSKKYIKKHEAKHCRCDCGYISKNNASLFKHQANNCLVTKEKDPNKNNVCKHCKTTFANRYLTRIHRQERGLCTICKDLYCGLTSHMLESHGVTVEVKGAEEGTVSEDGKVKIYKFVCTVCGWKGGRESRVLLHLIHHPQAVDDDIDVSILKKYNIL